jgi:hypothetical protein
MTRLRALLAAAAVALVGGAVSLSVALQDEAAVIDPPMACKEWGRRLGRHRESRREFFVLVQAGYDVPAAIGDRVIGDCQGRRCKISREDCQEDADSRAYSYRYRFETGGLVNGWRAAKADVHRYIAKGWQDLADAASEVVWLGSYKQAPANCVATSLSAAQCRNLLRSVNDCWREQPSGTIHTDGSHVPDTDDEWWPCVVVAGENPEVVAGRDYEVPPPEEE